VNGTCTEELNAILNKIKRKDINLHFPTGFIPRTNFNSNPMVTYVRKRTGHNPSTQGVYFYDATILSIRHLCKDLDIRKFEKSKLDGLGLMRDYFGIGPSGNYLSTMHLINFDKEKGKYEESI
jgi:hypothetical protein